ncbi:hypothetical protein GJ688_06025 [Heliobacillus mobilis]|uniref:Uncharacterized protein n=1 Tax=Heliobacterium mobile TaxID=28064 RepID=A0A6I3SI25_HELMO|nr:hypothetical protein [Heliobacterium mobile]MTV48539.1 hypothetical protein [Heliobacterium mobile]
MNLADNAGGQFSLTTNSEVCPSITEDMSGHLSSEGSSIPQLSLFSVVLFIFKVRFGIATVLEKTEQSGHNGQNCLSIR